MKRGDLKNKSGEELKSVLLEKRIRLDDLKFQLRQKKVKNVKELQAIRKDIARILTKLNSGSNQP